MAYKTSGFQFHDACLAETDLITDEEKALCIEFDEDAAAEKAAEQYEAPDTCDHCGAFLGEDTRAPESVLAQDLRNLAILYRDWQVTDLLWRLAAIADEHDAITSNLYRHSARILREWEHEIPATLFREHLPAIVHAAQIAITMIQKWAVKWDGRAILVLHEVTEEEEEAYPHLFQTYTHADAQHQGWNVEDTSGDLDMFFDGTARCDGCGTQIRSRVAYDPSDPNVAYGGCCFRIRIE